MTSSISLLDDSLLCAPSPGKLLQTCKWSHSGHMHAMCCLLPSVQHAVAVSLLMTRTLNRPTQWASAV